MQSTRLPKTNYRDPKRWNTVSVPERVAERAYTKHEVNEDWCWVSTYSTASHGYAQIGWQNDGNRHVVLAHRAAWTHVNGQVPIGMTLDHLCKNRRCVNPAHLRLLSNWENARRNQGDDWPFGTCRRGHPDTHLREVERTAKSGDKYLGMVCGVCDRENKRRWSETKASRRADQRTPRVKPTQEQIEASLARKKLKAREWYEQNRELTKARAAEWKRNNPEKVKVSNRASKARKALSDATIDHYAP